MINTALGVIVGNRDFFPDHLVSEARAETAGVCGKLGIETVMLDEEDTKLGGVETLADARRCAELFRARRDEISGVLVVLPNFGDEKGITETLNLASLDVPVLVQGYPDSPESLDPNSRRDAFCGKISVCNNLDQRGIPFTLTTRHVVHPSEAEFEADLAEFAAVCRVVAGLRTARLGAIGARPGAFNTVRYSEKILQAEGISVTTVDFSEILARAEAFADGDKAVAERLEAIGACGDGSAVPSEKLARMARLAAAISAWMDENELDASAIQCWTSVQQNYGINVCTAMSVMSQAMMPSACEVDVTGALAMYALQLASGTPSALADWNNNYGRDDDKCVLFHCGNWAKCFLPEARITTAPILGTVVGEDNTYGALSGRTPAGPLTFARISTDDTSGGIRAYVGQGELTDDELPTFGSRAVARVGRLQNLMRFICRNGFEHHVAISLSHCAGAVVEAMENYLGWDVYHHEGDEG